ncbi:hypothetical protein V6N12_038022 [Hibiscus sabdariffa]|uniref:Uncharacterized protein n=1 Tax=Hibiscus sabdariffa TaxID=183260 RepID=A0ABR2BWK2_9ROSI
MENRSSGGVNEYEDADTLELEEDGSINAAIKEHALVGKYGPWLRATSTWIKHNNGKNVTPSPQKNKPLLVDYQSREGEGQEKDIKSKETVPERCNSTRVEEATALATGKGLLIYPMVNTNAVVLSTDFLGETKDPGLSGIMDDHIEKGDKTNQITKAAMVMTGSVVNWNTSCTVPDQIYDKSIRGKSKITEEGFNEETDITIEDFMADSLKDMACVAGLLALAWVWSFSS